MDEPIRAIIVDDEVASIKILEQKIADNLPFVKIVSTAMNISTAIEVIDQLQPNLVFLDISLPDGEGFEIVERTRYQGYEIIFVTAYHQYAIKAFEFSALHYLVKPISTNLLIEAVSKVKDLHNNEASRSRLKILNENMQVKPQKIILKTTQGLEIVPIADIIHCESDNNNTVFHLKNGIDITVEKQIMTYEELLSDYNFVRVHNKHIINILCVTKYSKDNGGMAMLSNNTSIEISESRKKLFLEKLAEQKH